MSKKISLLIGLLLGLSLAGSWLLPATVYSGILGWLSAVFIVLLLSSKAPFLPLFLASTVSHLLSFYWLLSTISLFGGFPFPIAVLVYALFIVGSSLQFWISWFVARNLPAWTDTLAFRATAAWMVGELLSFKVFPWMLGHSQLGILPFAQAASLCGATGLTFFMVWGTEGVFSFIQGKYKQSLFPLLSLAFLIVYGLSQWNHKEEILSSAGKQKTIIVQGNISIEERMSGSPQERVTSSLLNLTTPLVSPYALVIWPEVAVQEWIPVGVRNITEDSHLPFIPDVSLIVGTLAYEYPTSRYNSAFGITPTGEVYAPYHKRVLMPFGEYTPFASWFPALVALNPNAGEFTSGKEIRLFSFPRSDSQQEQFQAAPLICYEDLLPELSREAVNRGADILVNLTNDAWFGDSVAPYQHEAIAAFRAIENRRPLIRSTNTGTTSVISPWGELYHPLPLFVEGSITREVPLIKENTPYTQLHLELVWTVLGWCMALIAGIYRVIIRGSNNLPRSQW